MNKENICYIVMPLSREDRVKIMAKQIRELQFGNYDKRILIVCDNSIISEQQIRNAFVGLKLDLIYTGEAEVYGLDMIIRRQRITNCWQIIKKYMQNKSGLVLAIEDDGNFDSGDFLKLENTYRHVQKIFNCGFVSGVEAGRWGLKMIGAWQMANEEKTIVKTVPFRSEGVVQIHAAGFYFFITTAQILASQEYRFNFFGPDWNFGMDLSAKGYFNFIDYSIRIGHDNGVRELLVDSECVVLEYSKDTEKIWRLIQNINSG